MEEQDSSEQGSPEQRPIPLDATFDVLIGAFSRLGERFTALSRMFSAEDVFDLQDESTLQELEQRRREFNESGKETSERLKEFIAAYSAMRRNVFGVGVIAALQKADRLDLLAEFPHAETLHAVLEAQGFVFQDLDDIDGWEMIIDPPP